MARIDRLLERQRRSLDALTDRQARDFLRLYDEARRDLFETMARLPPTLGGSRNLARTFTAQHQRVMRTQVEAAIRQLAGRLDATLGNQTRVMGEKAFEQLLQVIRLHEPDFRDAGGLIDTAVTRRLASERGLLVHRFSVNSYTAKIMADIQRELSTGALTGRSIPQMRDRLFASSGSVMRNGRSQAELVVRMELNSAYNRSSQAALEETAAITDEPGDPDPLLRKAVEFHDLRNNPISRVLDGMVTEIGEPWRVPVAAVARENARLNAARKGSKKSRRKVGGIVWPKVGGHYVGMVHPAHFFDRGRQVPHRRSWET